MNIALIGFGEAGLAIASSLGKGAGDELSRRAFDIKLDQRDVGLAELVPRKPGDVECSHAVWREL